MIFKVKSIISNKENEVLIRVGAYKKGADLELDNAISKGKKQESFLLKEL